MRENRSSGFPTRSDTNPSVCIQVARSSENKGADQLRSYSEADLRLCFCIGKSPVFLMTWLKWSAPLKVQYFGFYDGKWEILCLFVLSFNIPANIFSVMWGWWSHYLLGNSQYNGDKCILFKDIILCQLGSYLCPFPPTLDTLTTELPRSPV